MKVETKYEEGILTACILGEIDHHNAKAIREKIDSAIENHQPKQLILDFHLVNFMDSSGIGLMMGRYASMEKIGGTLGVIHVSKSIYKVIKLAKLDKLCDVKQRGEV